MLTNTEKVILRELGQQYMQAASHPRNRENIALWRALNRGEMIRPLINIDQLPYNELNADGALTCHVQDSFWREMEWWMRSELLKWNRFPGDMVLDPFFKIPAAVTNSMYGLAYDVERLSTDETNSVKSQRFTSMLGTDEDIEKIRDMVITHDKAETKRRMDEAQDLLGGIGPCRMGGVQFHLGIWDHLTQFMGIEEAFIAIMDRPEYVHKVLARMTQSVIAGIRQVNQLRISDDIASVCHCSFTYDDEFLPEPGQGRGPLTEHSWAFGMAQLFSSASPAVTEEFEIPYVSRLADHFGVIYYGCCDMLHDRLDLVAKIPHVRKVSCSPWSQKEKFTEAIRKDLIISNKPNPAFLAADSFDEDLIRKDLEESCALARKYGKNIELILKDLSTVHYEPQRLTRWNEIAMDVVNRF